MTGSVAYASEGVVKAVVVSRIVVDMWIHEVVGLIKLVVAADVA